MRRRKARRTNRTKPHQSDAVGHGKPRLWDRLGPGLITGAADDDPSGIATYSQAGASFGFSLSWTMLLTFPLMVSIQGISAQIGRTTGRGLAANFRVLYPKELLYCIVALLYIANVCNIGADLGAMAEATRLLIPAIPAWVLLLVYGSICAAGQVFLHHARYVAVLKWLTLSLLSYFAVLCVVKVHWQALGLSLIVPRFSLSSDGWLMVVAILGTTISPYLFFWQAAQETEDIKALRARLPLKRHPEQSKSALQRIKIDTYIGMAISNLVALAIMATAAATLHDGKHEHLDSAADAAMALKPLAGDFAYALFSLGIVATGLLSVPVLAGSAAYALGESRKWPVGLGRQPQKAKAFYGALIVATFLGALANVFKISPVKALVWSAVINALVAAPVMVLVMLVSTTSSIMGTLAVPRRLQWGGWAATAVMAAASLGFLISLVIPSVP